MVFTSELAEKNTKSNSYFATYTHDLNVHIGCIQHYIRITNCNCRKLCTCSGKHYACIRKCITINSLCINSPRNALKYIHELIICTY